MTSPLDMDLSSIDPSLLAPTKQEIVGLLRRAVNDIDRLEHSFSPGVDLTSLTAASRAVHLALIELERFA